ncbi:MAG: DNA topoisomerase, partial [Nanoarchaeota archaeon]
ELKVKEIKLHEKETQPPKRFTQASIIKELESKGLGTKATRSLILDTLYERNYIQERSIEVTDLGLKTVQTLKKYVPEILDEELTKHFEEELEQIQLKQKKPENILEEAKQFLTKSLNHFKENELKIGKELLEANRETQAQTSLIGKCPNCEDGILSLRRGRFGLFISCDKYEKCGTTFSIPKGALIKSTKEVCSHCQHPKILVIKQGKRPMEICINKECPSKKSEIKLDKKKKCPTCGSELVIRKSIYNAFIGCSTYPKCRYVEYVNNNKIKQKA